VKALALTGDSILVSWLPPDQPNGIIVQYTVYMIQGGRPKVQKKKLYKLFCSTYSHILLYKLTMNIYFILDLVLFLLQSSLSLYQMSLSYVPLPAISFGYTRWQVIKTLKIKSSSLLGCDALLIGKIC